MPRIRWASETISSSLEREKMGSIHKKTIRRILTESRDLISDKTKWCRLRIAIDQSGNSVLPTSSKAVQFCAIGAICHAAGEKLKDVTKDKIFLGKRAGAVVKHLYDFLPEDDQAYLDAEVEDDPDLVYVETYLESINDKNGHGRRRVIAAMNRAIEDLNGE